MGCDGTGATKRTAMMEQDPDLPLGWYRLPKPTEDDVRKALSELAEEAKAAMTKEEVKKAIEDYFAETSTSKEDMEELVDLITGLIENHDWSVER
jgi:lipoate-protein ligase A